MAISSESKLPSKINFFAAAYTDAFAQKVAKFPKATKNPEIKASR